MNDFYNDFDILDSDDSLILDNYINTIILIY